MNDKVLVAGTFDLLHLGHMRYLERCAELGNVIVALSTDKNAERKRRPILHHAERRAILRMLPWVYAIISKDVPSLRPFIRQEKPDVVTYGSDWERTAWLNENKIDSYYLDTQAFRLVEIPNEGIQSTTEIIERIRDARDTTKECNFREIARRIRGCVQTQLGEAARTRILVSTLY